MTIRVKGDKCFERKRRLIQRAALVVDENSVVLTTRFRLSLAP